jgi:hypothetical protein
MNGKECEEEKKPEPDLQSLHFEQASETKQKKVELVSNLLLSLLIKFYFFVQLKKEHIVNVHSKTFFSF